MSLPESVKICLSKYAMFDGRATRSEYWWFQLFVVLLYVVLFILAVVAKSPWLFVLFLGIVLPSIAVTVRRLHDTGRSGWWFLLGFVPFGGLVILVFACQDSSHERNKYGDSPKPWPAASGPDTPGNWTPSQRS